MTAEDVSSISGEFADAPLGDKRRSARLVRIVEAMARDPKLSFPEAMGSSAHLEGTYRFLSNKAVTPEGVLEPHFRATRERCGSCKEVLVVHDTTSFAFGGDAQRDGLGFITSGGKGFLSHISLAVQPGKERLPLGVVAVHNWVRATVPASVTGSDHPLS